MNEIQKEQIPESCAYCDNFDGEYGFCKILNRGGKLNLNTNRFEDCPIEKNINQLKLSLRGIYE